MTHLRLLTCGLLVLSLALAHNWQELKSPELSQQELEQLISIAESLQADLPTDTPALMTDALAKDWLVWLSDGLMLYSREGQVELVVKLKNAGFSAMDDDDLVEYWQHEMDHLVVIYDALMQRELDTEVLIEELDNLPLESEADYQTAERLYYALYLPSVSDTKKTLLAPFASRWQQLIAQAQGGWR